MAYLNFALICFLLMFTACFDHGEMDSGRLENGHPIVDKWQRENEKRLLESLTLLTEMTYEYLDGNVQRTAWQQAWYKAHNQWLESSLLGFVSDVNKIDAWPITPGFLDSIDKYPLTGIVNDFSIDITRKVLQHQNQITDSNEVALGFHVLEYYAFSRPENDLKETDETSSRRRLFILLVTELLLLEVSELIGNQTSRSTPVLERMLIRSHALLSEFNRLGEHGQFSESSLTNISVQLRSMSKLIEKPTAFSKHLNGLNRELTEVFIIGLDEANELVNSPSGLTEASSSRLLLLLSSLSHHVEEFLRLSKRRTISEY